MAKFILKFTIPGMPRGTGRARYNARGGYIYTPKSTRHATSNARACALEAMIKAKLPRKITVAVAVTVTAKYAPPVSYTKKARALALATIWRPFAPDIDNLAKLALDAMTGVVFADDRQVVAMNVVKQWALVPGMDVEVEALEEV